MSYWKVAVKGVGWMAALRIINRGLGLLRIAILARILTPEQFGVFGIAILVLGFLEIFTESGINVFLIQEGDLKKHLNSAWFVSIFRGILIGLSIFLFAGPISVFFNAPNAWGILILTSLIPLVRGFINPAVVKFQKNLVFSKEFVMQAPLFAVETAVAIGVGIGTGSESALIWGMLASALVEVVISFVFITPRPKLIFEWDLTKRVVNKGKWVTLAGIMEYVFSHFDDFVVGKVLGTFSLGLYQNAYKISTLLIVETQAVFNKVSFPVFTAISSNQKRLMKLFLNTWLAVGVFALLSGFVLYVLARPLVLLFLGENWLGALPVLKVLVIYGVLKAVANSTHALFLSLGKQRMVAQINSIGTLALVLTIFPFVARYGLVGAGYSTIIGVLASFGLTIYYLWKFQNTQKEKLRSEE